MINKEFKQWVKEQQFQDCNPVSIIPKIYNYLQQHPHLLKEDREIEKLPKNRKYTSTGYTEYHGDLEDEPSAKTTPTDPVLAKYESKIKELQAENAKLRGEITDLQMALKNLT